jgi:prepilin-type N-terminal cleavage/methylation domain-containing protein
VELPLATRHSPLAARSGFTLVEMLTVVVIIGILASFITAAAWAAVKKARIFTIHQEVMQLDMAVKALQTDCGDYPPDFSDWTGSDSLAVDRWLLKAFPRYVTGSNTPSKQMVTDIQNNYKVSVANPASALVVFLGGVPAVAGAYNSYSVQTPTGGIPWRSDGFNADPTSPFTPGQPRIKAKFEFPSARVDTSTGSPFFVPPRVSATPNSAIPAIPLPYVYFRAGLDQSSGAWCYNYNNGSTNVTQQFPSSSSSGNDQCVPYQKVVPSGNSAVINPPWRNNDTFQIISSGLDGLYGNHATPRISGTPTGLSLTDLDNIANFVQNGSTLESDMSP